MSLLEASAPVHLDDLVAVLVTAGLAGEATAPAAFADAANPEITDLVADSRRAGPGSCFACLPGRVTDGHDYAAEAVARGAAALLVERPLGLGVPEVQVPSTRRVLGPLAARFHGDPSRAMRCLGVTGTNGKTTTTYLLRAIAEGQGARSGIIGTTGVEFSGTRRTLTHTTPEATELQATLAAMRDAGVEVVALEVSSHALSEHRVDGTWFTAAAFTSFSQDHLDYHGTLDEYFAAKARLFEPDRCGAAAVNRDDPSGRSVERLARARGIPVVTYALEDLAADVGIETVDGASDGVPTTTELRIVDRRAATWVEVRRPLPGRHNLANLLAAIATTLAAGGELADVAPGLQAPVRIPGRVEAVEAGQPFSVLVDYAHTPDALRAALAAARELAGPDPVARVIVVFGCGGDRDRSKRPVMGEAAGEGADFVVLTSDNPRSEDPAAIADATRSGLDATSTRYTVELDRRRAIELAIAEAAPGDVVVIAGKGHETGQVARGITVPFDDRLVARELIEARWN